MSKSPVDPVELAEAVLRRLKDRETLVALRDESGACIECGMTEGHENGCALKKLEQEIEAAKVEWTEVATKIGPAQAEHDQAVAAEDKHKNYDKPLPEGVAKTTDRTLSALFAWMDRKVVLENLLAKLQSPGELERRRETNNRLKEVRVASNSKKDTARDQGVPGTYLGAGGNFKPGMDARYKSDLITSALGETISSKGLHQFTKDSAIERLQQRGWMAHLEKAKKSRAAKAAKKAEKAKATPRVRSTRTTTKAETATKKGTPRKRSTRKAA